MLDVANARRRFTCFSFGFFLYVWPAAGVNKNGLGFFFYYKRGKADRVSVVGLVLQQLQE